MHPLNLNPNWFSDTWYGPAQEPPSRLLGELGIVVATSVAAAAHRLLFGRSTRWDSRQDGSEG